VATDDLVATDELEAQMDLDALNAPKELKAQMNLEAPSAQHLPHPFPTGDFQNRIHSLDTSVDAEDFLEGDF